MVTWLARDSLGRVDDHVERLMVLGTMIGWRSGFPKYLFLSGLSGWLRGQLGWEVLAMSRKHGIMEMLFP
jgi:hypothetical protein|tara:strand:- start:593 stop:802 length:210 start_codon:yes stop_codon:yes gene_type:complete